MYYITKKLEISGSHHLVLDHESKCCNHHGHNWQIEVCCKSATLDRNGMVVDFSHISSVVSRLDHHDLNEVLGMNPTSENIARWICEQVPHCYRVSVMETAGNMVVYQKDE